MVIEYLDPGGSGVGCRVQGLGNFTAEDVRKLWENCSWANLKFIAL